MFFPLYEGFYFNSVTTIDDQSDTVSDDCELSNNNKLFINNCKCIPNTSSPFTDNSQLTNLCMFLFTVFCFSAVSLGVKYFLMIEAEDGFFQFSNILKLKPLLTYRK